MALIGYRALAAAVLLRVQTDFSAIIEAAVFLRKKQRPLPPNARSGVSANQESLDES